jgi:pilus assembly protein CpaC
MRLTFKWAIGAFCMVLAGSFAAPLRADAPVMAASEDAEVSSTGVFTVPARTAFPLAKKVSIGVSKSLMIQFPFELRDVLVSDPERLDAVVQTSDRVFLIAKKAGTTNAFFFDARGQQIMTLEVSIGADLTSLDSLLRRLLPGSNIKSELAGASVVLTGTVRTPADSMRAADITTQFAQANKNLIGSSLTSQRTEVGGVTTWQIQSNSQRDNEKSKLVINLLTVEGEEQVMLKVTVAEIQRSILKQFGINIGAEVNAGNFGTALLTSSGLPVTATTLGKMGQIGSQLVTGPNGATIPFGAGCTIVQPSIDTNVLSNSGMFSSYAAGNHCLAQTLKALERDGLVRTLAEPNLTAVSGETAKFPAGGEFPVPVSVDINTVGISFKEFGIGVAFTPVVLSEGRISLKIETEVSELSSDGALVLSGTQIPSLKKRQAKSTVELPSGGSLALAGLISDSTKQNIDGFPGLKDVPILGTLFRSRDFQKAETELVVIVTPYLVRPTSRQLLARPDDGFAPASDLKANFLGHLNRVYGTGRVLPDGGLKGDYGFIVE